MARIQVGRRLTQILRDWIGPILIGWLPEGTVRYWRTILHIPVLGRRTWEEVGVESMPSDPGNTWLGQMADLTLGQGRRKRSTRFVSSE